MKIKRTFIFSLFCGIIFCQNIFALSSVKEFTNHLDSFANQLNYVIPNGATEQNVYSEAWIGYFYPSTTKHFSLGIESGITQLNMDDLTFCAEELRIFSVPKTFAYPTLGLNGKIGGLFLPFDIGLSFFTIDTSKFKTKQSDIDFNIFVIGTNIRFAILKGKGAWPKLSLGAGYYFSNGGISCNAGDSFIKFNNLTHTLVGEIQLSKKFIFVTPFLGLRGIFAKANTSCNWNSTIALEENNSTFTNGTTSCEVDFLDSFIPQAFGGIGLTLGLIQLDTNVSYDITHNLWSGGISIRMWPEEKN